MLIAEQHARAVPEFGRRGTLEHGAGAADRCARGLRARAHPLSGQARGDPDLPRADRRVILAVAACMWPGRSRSWWRSRLFLLALWHIRSTLQSRGRQQRHRVLDDLEPDHAADRRRAADLRDVPASPVARHAIRADCDLYRREPADRGMADARLLRRHARSTSRRARRSTAPRSSACSSPSRCRWCARGSRRRSCWCFILAWNEFLLALFLTNANAQTMPVLVAAQNTTRGPQWWYMSVLIVIMIAPVIIIAAFLQKHIARGLLVGAVKG